MISRFISCLYVLFLEKLQLGKTVKSTELSLKGGDNSAGRWLFEESLIDNNHCVSVCTEPPPSQSRQQDCDREFTILTTENLLAMDSVDTQVDSSIWDKFNSKQFSNR